MKLDSAVYPCFVLYPGKAVEAGRNRSGNKLEINVNLPSLYPCIHICQRASLLFLSDNTEDCCIDSPAYPNFEFYPALMASKGNTDSMTLSSGSEACPHLVTYSFITKESNSAKSEVITEVHSCRLHPCIVACTLC